MKTYVSLLLFFLSVASFSQNNHIVKTEDGRRVLLKADYTWEYIDAVAPAKSKEEKEMPEPDDACNVGADFTEPKLSSKIQNYLKRGRATIDDIKNKVAKDYECTVEDVVLLSASERKSKGIYIFCACGEKVTYKRNGHVIIEKGKFF